MNFTIKGKLTLILSIFIACMLALGCVGLYSMQQINQGSQTISYTALPSVSYSRQINTLIDDYRLGLSKYIMAASPEELKKYEQQMAGIDETIKQVFNEYAATIEKGNYVSVEVRETAKVSLQKIRACWDDYLAAQRQVLLLKAQGNSAAATDYFNTVCAATAGQAMKEAETIVTDNEKAAAAISDDIAQSYHNV